MPNLASLEKLLHGPRDNALLRHAIGLLHLEAGAADCAAPFFADAVARDPDFSAGWKMLGKARQQLGDMTAARVAYQRGIDVAEKRGDLQAAKEMKVFLRRLEPR